MKKIILLGSLCFSLAACAQTTPPNTQTTTTPTVTAYTYQCDNQQTVTARYISLDKNNPAEPVFVALSYKEYQLGLSPAVSASGARYVGLVGLDLESGVQWWEAKDTATLSRVNQKDTSDTTPILENCKISQP